MTQQKNYILQDVREVDPFKEVCGFIRPLLDASHNTSAEFYFVDVNNADEHFHKKTEEFYYVLEGVGTMKLGEDEVDLHPGVLVCIRSGVVHQAVPKIGSSLKALVVAVPPGLANDIYAPSGKQLSMEKPEEKQNSQPR